MNSGRTLFSQVMEFLPLREFHECVKRYGGDYKVKTFSCLDQFYCMAFAQLTYRESLRDIEACLRSRGTRLYHMGIRSNVSRNTLANANSVRNWRLYADFAYVLIEIARGLYGNDSFGIELKDTAYAFDSTTIDLCLALFPWARFHQGKGAVKMHTLLDLRGNIPTFIEISEGNVHDVNALDHLPLQAGCFLHNGPRLHGFCALESVYSAGRVLRRPHQNKFALCSVSMAYSRSAHWSAL